MVTWFSLRWGRRWSRKWFTVALGNDHRWTAQDTFNNWSVRRHSKVFAIFSVGQNIVVCDTFSKEVHILFTCKCISSWSSLTIGSFCLELCRICIVLTLPRFLHLQTHETFLLYLLPTAWTLSAMLQTELGEGTSNVSWVRSGLHSDFK